VTCQTQLKEAQAEIQRLREENNALKDRQGLHSDPLSESNADYLPNIQKPKGPEKTEITRMAKLFATMQTLWVPPAAFNGLCPPPFVTVAERYKSDKNILTHITYLLYLHILLKSHNRMSASFDSFRGKVRLESILNMM
jgi:hypothetical protein